MTNPRSPVDGGPPTKAELPADPTPAAVIFDIDGTVADCRHRAHHIITDSPDWASFFAASSADLPLADGVSLALKHAATGRLLWLTARPEAYRAQTGAWLDEHGLPSDPLHMRPDDDLRPAAVFKAERIRQIAAEQPILLIVDDDDLVVAALREAGWPVQHVQWMSP